VIAGCVVGVVGLAMTGFAKDPVERYAGTLLGLGGINCLIATNLTWAQNNVRDDAKRSVVTVIRFPWRRLEVSTPLWSSETMCARQPLTYTT